MMYQTGGGTSFEFLDALCAFAVANGWTQTRAPFTTGSWRIAYLERGVAHIALGMRNDVVSWDADANANQPDHTLFAYPYADITAARNQIWGHPGAPVDTEEYGYFSQANGFSNNIAKWNLYSNEAGSVIHAAVQCSGDRFTHFSFGLIDKSGMGHSGAAFTTGTQNRWTREYSGGNPGENGYTYNKPEAKRSVVNDMTCLYVPDALPAAFAGPMVSPYAWNMASGRPVNANPYNPILHYRDPGSLSANGGPGDGRLLEHVIGARTPAWSGKLPMFGIPAIVQTRSADRRYCAIGMFPDIRLCNLEGLLPGQEVDLGGETWVVYPIQRQLGWTAFGFSVSSGQYGVAYRKVT